MKEKDSKGLTVEKDEFSDWFSQIMLKAELADYTNVSGCIVFRPAAYEIWERIKEETDKRFKKIGIRNAYFPLFIPEKLLNKEKEHVEDFAPHVAWVTHGGSKKLSERLAIRPTSETIMYDSYSKWIRSWRDLPLKLNQWNNVVRWEFNNPVPFFRTREFLWNEGHTVFATEGEALAEGKDLEKAYQEVCEDCLALFGVWGRKTEKEKFAGAEFSEKLHFILPNGRVIEGPAFHHDGQKFAKAYDIKFLDKDGREKFAWQNTFAISTRMLGTVFAIHSDEKGLVLPPRILDKKIVIVPIYDDEKKKEVLKFAGEIEKKLEEIGVFLDDREGYRPGFKFNEWELKGIPLRIEIGPKEVEAKKVVIVRRDNGKKEIVKTEEVLKKSKSLIEEIHKNLFEKSKKLYLSKLDRAENMKELKLKLKEGKMVLVPLSANKKVEEELKAETGGAKTIFISKEERVNKEKCVVSGEKADYWVYVGRSY